MNVLVRNLILISSIFVLFSCGQTSDEKRKSAILTAKNYLTLRECDKALETLAHVGIDNKNARYLQTLSSAYACKADYSEPVFYGKNLLLVDSTSTGFLGSLTKFNTSKISAPDDPSFVLLQTAIDTLLYAGGLVTPSSAGREDVFEENDAGDINAQLLYMLLTQLGKYFYFYGNANPTDGIKGTGTSLNGNSNGYTNTCLYTYVQATSLAAIAQGITGSCTVANNTGHPLIVNASSTTKVKRMCQGIVLFNNLIDVITNMDFPSSAGSIDTVGSTLQTTLTTLCSFAQSSTICTIKSQSQCEEDFASDLNSLESFFAIIFENLFR